MAYSGEALNSLLRRKRQYEAMGGRLSTHETEGIVRGVLSTEAGKDIEASRIAKAEALDKERLDIQKKAVQDEERAGLLRTGMTALNTDIGKKAVGKVGDWLGIGEKTTPTVSDVSPSGVPLKTATPYTGATPAIIGGGAATVAVTGLGEAGIPLTTATPYAAEAVGMEGILGAIPSAPTVTAPATSGILGTAGQVALPTAIGSVAGGWLGSQKSFQEITPWGGKKTEKMMGGALGGVAAGAAFGGPVGAVIGGVVGAVTGGTVICSELHRQGYITPEELELDSEYRIKYIDDETYTGYLSWATKVVELMQKSKIVTQIVRPFGVGWAKEMSHRLEPERKGSLIGKLLLKFGVPICRYIGKRRESWVGAER